ncbi:MAG: polymerase sigma-70 factor, subfamily protein [Labilithrix sp.]|nr:polymerase sigma-70 factor, subfamily protein [Labilithrix sp.]
MTPGAPTTSAPHEPLLRELAPQVLAIVARRSGDFAAAEDAVQEALAAAAQQWPRTGLPESPRAWLVHVARRRLTDEVRADVSRRRREEAVARLEPEHERVVPSPDDERAVPERDDTLLLLFMCCHPALTRPSAIALTLRAAGGLTTAAIASAFLVPEATMAQRISRAKETIRRSGLGFTMPTAAERAARLGAVRSVLYLVFNEGYASSGGPELARVDLSNEAIRLTRALREVTPDDRETTGLLALMLLTDARRAARTGPGGELVPLDEQDRGRWDRAAIAEGSALATLAFSAGDVGAYQVQAAIAALHDGAPSVEATDWKEVAALYGVLEGISGSPMVTLNRAVAIAMAEGPRAGLALLARLAADPRLTEHHRLAAVRAHLHERLGEIDEARAAYRAAADRTRSDREREYLLGRAARLG